MGNRAFTFPQAQTFHPQEPSRRAVPGDTRAFSLLLTSVALASLWTLPPRGGLAARSGRAEPLRESNDVLRASTALGMPPS